MGRLFETLRKAIARVEARGETRYRLAQRTGVSQATLSRIVNRQTASIRLATLERLVDALGIEVRLRRGGKRRKR